MLCGFAAGRGLELGERPHSKAAPSASGGGAGTGGLPALNQEELQKHAGILGREGFIAERWPPHLDCKYKYMGGSLLGWPTFYFAI